jgi:AbiV family abortive infection protein
MTKEDYFDGIFKSISNASDLYGDAELLFNNSRYSRAYTLYQLAIEEIGKASMIYSFILYKDYNQTSEQDKFKKEFVDHKKKTQSSIGIDVLLAFQISDLKLKKGLMYQAYKQLQDVKSLNKLKNQSLYTDLIEGVFKLPREVISFELTSEIKTLVKTRLNTAEEFYKIGITNFTQIKQAALDFDEKEMLENPPEEFLEIIKLETELARIEDQKKGLL